MKCDFNLESKTVKELYMLSKSYKLSVIEMLIDSIAQDEVYDANAERETEIESKSLQELADTLNIDHPSEMRNIPNNPKKNKPQAPQNQVFKTDPNWGKKINKLNSKEFSSYL